MHPSDNLKAKPRCQNYLSMSLSRREDIIDSLIWTPNANIETAFKACFVFNAPMPF